MFIFFLELQRLDFGNGVLRAPLATGEDNRWTRTKAGKLDVGVGGRRRWWTEGGAGALGLPKFQQQVRWIDSSMRGTVELSLSWVENWHRLVIFDWNSWTYTPYVRVVCFWKKNRSCLPKIGNWCLVIFPYIWMVDIIFTVCGELGNTVFTFGYNFFWKDSFGYKLKG